MRLVSHIDSPPPKPRPLEKPTQESRVSNLDKPKTTHQSLDDLIPVAVISPDDAMTAEWLEGFIRDLHANAGLASLPHGSGQHLDLARDCVVVK